MDQILTTTIRTIGQSIGIAHIQDSVTSILGHEIQVSILSILSDAIQFKKSRKGRKLKISDINLALKANKMQPCLGYTTNSSYYYEKVGNFHSVQLFVLPQKSVPIEERVQFNAPQYPLETSFEMEWIALNGQMKKTEEESRQFNENLEQSQVHQIENDQNQSDELAIASSKHVFSYEDQLFYKISLDNLLSESEQNRQYILAILHSEQAIQCFIPYFIRFSLHEIKQHPYEFRNLSIACNTIKSIVMNPLLNHDPYLEQYLSICMTILFSPLATVPNITEFCTLKESASILMAKLNDIISHRYPEIFPSIMKQIMTILLSGKDLAAKYGAFNALVAMGSNTISSYAISTLPTLEREIRKANREPEKAALAQRFHSLAIEAMGLLIHRDSYLISATGYNVFHSLSAKDYKTNIVLFGEELHRYYIDDSSFLSI